MTAYLRLDDPGVRAALRHPALQGLPRIGRGAFCAVYDKGDTVLKLTCDPVAYEYAAGPFRPQGEHFPRLVKSHSCIGETGKEEPLYLFEAEKLTPIRRGQTPAALQRQARQLYQQIRKANWYGRWNVNPFACRDREAYLQALSRFTFDEAAKDTTLAPDMCAAMKQLAKFASDAEAIEDCHMGNFMLRGETLVLNDAVAGRESIKRLREYQHEQYARWCQRRQSAANVFLQAKSRVSVVAPDIGRDNVLIDTPCTKGACQ